MSDTADDSIKYSPHRLESTAMSNTPRTDEETYRAPHGSLVVRAQFAQQLERELAALEKKLQRALSSLRSYDDLLADYIEGMKS